MVISLPTSDSSSLRLHDFLFAHSRIRCVSSLSLLFGRLQSSVRNPILYPEKLSTSTAPRISRVLEVGITVSMAAWSVIACGEVEHVSEPVSSR